MKRNILYTKKLKERKLFLFCDVDLTKKSIESTSSGYSDIPDKQNINLKDNSNLELDKVVLS